MKNFTSLPTKRLRSLLLAAILGSGALSAQTSVSATLTTLCSGNSTTLTASGATAYAWQPGNLSGNSVTVMPWVTTTYTVTGTDANGSSTATITITVNPEPVVTPSSSPAQICVGGSTTLSATGADTYTWQPGNLSGSSVTVTPSQTTMYFVTGTSAAGCTSTRPIIVPVSPNPTLSVTATATTLTTCYGTQCATLTADASGAKAPYTYSWSTGAQTASTSVCPNGTTTYSVTVADVDGCSTTGTVTIDVINACCGPNNNKVLLCHNGHEICVAQAAVPAHLAHGDVIGGCTGLRTMAGAEAADGTVAAYPNPFDQNVSIEVNGNSGDAAHIEIRDLTGRTVAVIFDGTLAENGQLFTWSPADGLGQGVYFCSVTLNGETQVMKLVYQF